MSPRTIAPILVLLFAVPLAGQSPIHDIVEAARAGNWYVRMATLSNDTVQGRITAIRRDTVRFMRTSVLLSDVASIDRRFRRGGGALPAGLFGATAFGLIGLGLSGLCEFDCDYAWVLPTIGGAAMGMAMGTVAGALVAPGRPEWRRVHPPLDSAHVVDAVARDPAPYAGGAVTFSFGTGWSFEERRYRVVRLGLQLSGTSRSERPVETTGEFQIIGVPDGGAALYVGAGANVMMPSGMYGGPAVGFLLTDGPTPTLGVRTGWRPRRTGLRPELRADYAFHESAALLLTVSVGLDVH